MTALTNTGGHGAGVRSHYKVADRSHYEVAALRVRYYDANVGRLTSMDPFEGNVRQPTSLNKYVYAFADPVNFSDPSGNYPVNRFLGTAVHTYLAAQFELGASPNVPRFGNRYVSTIAQRLVTGYSGGVDSRRPDFVEAFPNVAPPQGDVYELKHVNLDVPGSSVAASADAVGEAVWYAGILRAAVPSYTWHLGASLWPGAQVWREFPGNPPGYTLMTFTDYESAHGAVLYDFVENQDVEWIRILVGVTVFSGVLSGYIAERLQVRSALQAARVLIRIGVGAQSAQRETTSTIATLTGIFF